MLKIKTKKKGFTLIEVVLSITILAIVVSPILSMVLTSVKINKESEDKQKALYIAQQTVEHEKASSSITVGTSPPTTIMNFTVKKTIAELPQYKFKDVNMSSEDNSISQENNTNSATKTFNDIKYDVKLEVNSTEDGTTLNITYYNQDDDENYKKVKLNTDSNVLNITNCDDYIIINVNKGDDIKVEDDPNKTVSYKLSSSEEEKEDNVILQYNTDTQPNINIHGLNNCDENLIFYFATSKDKEFNYSLINDGGQIKSYYNIFAADSQHSYSNSSRVYRIDVEVSKSGKSLQKLTAFKTAAE